MKRRRIFLNITVTVLTIAIVLLMVAVYLQYELAQLKEEIILLEKENRDTEVQKSNIFTTQRILDETKNDREKIDGYFIENEAEIVTFLERLEKTGEKYALEPSVSIDTIGVGNDQKLSVNISAEGPFKNLYTYLVLLENFPVKAVFESVSLRKLSDGPGGGVPEWSLRVIFTVESYNV